MKQDVDICCKAEANGGEGDLDNQADTFSGRKSSRISKSDYNRRQDELQSLASLIPDPMKDESLLDPSELLTHFPSILTKFFLLESIFWYSICFNWDIDL